MALHKMCSDLAWPTIHKLNTWMITQRSRFVCGILRSKNMLVSPCSSYIISDIGFESQIYDYQVAYGGLSDS